MLPFSFDLKYSGSQHFYHHVHEAMNAQSQRKLNEGKSLHKFPIIQLSCAKDAKGVTETLTRSEEFETHKILLTKH